MSVDGTTDTGAERIFANYCEDKLEGVCSKMPKDKAITLLLDQIIDLSDLKGKELAEHIAQQIATVSKLPPEQRNFSESMSEMFKNDSSLVSSHVGVPDLNKTASQRERGGDGQMLQVLQGQIGKLKRELLMQNQEITTFTQELQDGKEKLEQQLKTQMALFETNSEKILDAERFSAITRGLHVSSTVEEKFEEVQAVYNSKRSITLLYRISKDLILVNGPATNIDVLSTKDLKVVYTLETNGEMPFSACQVDNLLYIGCNKGHIFIFNSDDSYK